MRTEWIAFLAVLGAAFFCFSRIRGLGKRGGALVFLIVASTVFWARLVDVRVESHVQREAAFDKTIPGEGRPGGYVSSDQCQACHPSQYDSWHQSFHRTMTQRANGQSVVGDFNEVALELLGKNYQLQRRGDEFWVEMDDPD